MTGKRAAFSFSEAEGQGRKASVTEVALEDPALEELIGASKAAALREEVELAGGRPGV